ncbi:MAG: hypothetical protein WCV90_07870 [Candidatus Woesearchaeota archaeon]
MQRIRISLTNIGSVLGCHPNDYRGNELVERIIKEGWEGIRPIPVIKLPPDFITDGREYYQDDGNHRYAGAFLRGDKDIECICYGPEDDLEAVSLITTGRRNSLHSYSDVLSVLKLDFHKDRSRGILSPK